MDHDQAVKSQVCEKYLLGELSPELRNAFEEHYFSCVECAMQLRTAAELIGASQQILARAPAIAAKVHAASNPPRSRTSRQAARRAPRRIRHAVQTASTSMAVQNWNTSPVDVDKNPQRLWDWRDAQFLRALVDSKY